MNISKTLIMDLEPEIQDFIGLEDDDTNEIYFRRIRVQRVLAPADVEATRLRIITEQQALGVEVVGVFAVTPKHLKGTETFFAVHWRRRKFSDKDFVLDIEAARRFQRGPKPLLLIA